MTPELESAVREICAAHDRDPLRLMDILRAVQQRCGSISSPIIARIAAELRIPRVRVESTATFYAFFTAQPTGRIVIRVCNDVIDELQGGQRVLAAFEQELGIRVGETTPDGLITLTETACIGMCDQAPAALVNDVVVTRLSTDRAREIVQALRANPDPKALVTRLGDGNNGHALVGAMVENNLRYAEPAYVFSPLARGVALSKAVAMSPAEIIRAVKVSRLRGRGGAGFPTGMKWEFARAAPGDRKFIVCNADEGEPGTFKDRVILTECPDRVFAGMTIAGYAIGAAEGVLYLRAEYAYLRAFLEDVLARRRAEGLLGQRVAGKAGFNFDIRIQMGAGAYICGEETALLNSCEGLRGDPRNRPPFPAQRGYLGCPTVVNNVETLCKVVKIIQDGPAAFAEHGSAGSSGTKLLSISGDCKRPGVYEVAFGVTLRHVLELCGAEDAAAVQVGGPSGQLVPRSQYDRKICYDDLATGGSVMVFGPQRDLVHVVRRFLDFFAEESCGYCTPCRVGTRLLIERLAHIQAGRGSPDDLAYLEELGQTIKLTSRCGLGQTAANPVLTSLKNFPEVWAGRVRARSNGHQPGFDLSTAVGAAELIVGRRSAHAHAAS